jgi:amino acid transporter
MGEHTATAAPGAVPAAVARLEPDAINVAQDTFIGLATTGPCVSIGFTLAALAVTAAYAGAIVLILTAIPMLVIANAYRRLNLWNANCGASFEWVGRAINPYLGFITGWLMVAGTLIGTLTPVLVLGPNVLAVFGSSGTSTWPNVAIATAIAVVMLVIAVVGIRLTARTQVAIGVVEYLLIIVFSVWGLIWVLGHHSGTFHITSGWFSLHGIGGKGSLAAGFLIAVFMYTGWDGTLYVNEEVRHRRVNPGRAAMIAVTVAAGIFILAQVGLQGVVSPKKLQANSSEVLGYLGQVLGGNAGGKALALALALSVIAATGAGILLTARILYGMASHRVLPPALGNVSTRFSTPVVATVLSGVVLIALAWVNLLTTSVQGAFNNVLNETGILYATFYMLTALAAIVYYRRRVVSSVSDAITLGILPLGSIVFLGWVVVKFMQQSTPSENWSLGGVVALGVVLLLAARFILRSPFFKIKRESDAQAR